MAPNKERTARLTILIDPRKKAAFERLCAAEDVTPSQVVRRLDREHDGEPVPSIVFTKGGGAWLEAIAGTGCDAVGLDWTVDIGEARARVGARCALQGNLDPAVLLAGEDAVRSEVRRVLNDFGSPCGADGSWADARQGKS